MKILLSFVLVLVTWQLSWSMSPLNIHAMDTLPYRQIPDYPAHITPETVMARMIDGVGFRYYWATEGLRPEDLAFRPTPEARSAEETIDHIMGLTMMVLNSVEGKANTRSGEEASALPFEYKRRTTLEQLHAVSEALKTGAVRLEDIQIIFQRGDTTVEYPFWNDINGPISDALWHIGQVVSFRRSSGNPFDGRASVLTGKVRE